VAVRPGAKVLSGCEDVGVCWISELVTGAGERGVHAASSMKRSRTGNDLLGMITFEVDKSVQ
jgi:hypothetical protein